MAHWFNKYTAQRRLQEATGANNDNVGPSRTQSCARHCWANVCLLPRALDPTVKTTVRLVNSTTPVVVVGALTLSLQLLSLSWV